MDSWQNNCHVVINVNCKSLPCCVHSPRPACSRCSRSQFWWWSGSVDKTGPIGSWSHGTKGTCWLHSASWTPNSLCQIMRRIINNYIVWFPTVLTVSHFNAFEAFDFDLSGLELFHFVLIWNRFTSFFSGFLYHSKRHKTCLHFLSTSVSGNG